MKIEIENHVIVIDPSLFNLKLSNKLYTIHFFITILYILNTFLKNANKVPLFPVFPLYRYHF